MSFEEVDQPGSSIANQPISLTYVRDRENSSRLAVTIGSVTYYHSIPDWQLKPIVEFANSDYTGAVSLFGKGPDRVHYYYIQYHEAFKDTLLGMRLLHADILLIDLEHHWRLPKWNGKVILGHGETMPDEVSARRAKHLIRDAFQGHKFQSWVLTDTETNPRFHVVNGKLRLTATPYFYFWI